MGRELKVTGFFFGACGKEEELARSQVGEGRECWRRMGDKLLGLQEK